MKNISKIICFSFLFGLITWSCKKEETKDYYLGGTAPVLSSTVNGNIPLDYATANSTAITFNWTNPNFGFTTGSSSQNVKYILEIDTAGSNFTNPLRKSIGVPTDLTYTILQKDLNDILNNQLVLVDSIPHTLQVRVTATLGGGAVALASNVLTLIATPYNIPPKVNPPATGELYITGGATPAGWMGSGDAPLASQKFTQISPTLYQIVIALKGGDNTTDKDQFLIVPAYGNWSNKYAGDKTQTLTSTSGDFGYNWGDNFPAPAAAGTYLVEVNFKTGKYSITPH